jgi:outer membrane protein assembly factor BamC
VRRALAAAALALLAAACSTDSLVDGSSRIEYKSATKLPPLDVPPDLTAPPRDGRYQVPDGGRGAATLSGYQAERSQQAGQPRGDPTVLPGVEGVRIERDGNQRWLVVNQPAERLWPAMKSFWVENGLLIALEIPEAGVMETDWAENRALISQNLVRSKIGSIFEPLASTGMRDKYRMRLERRPDGGTEVYISHRGLEEVYATLVEGAGETAWQPRPPDPELEAEFLRRLMVRLGTPAEEAKLKLAAVPAPAARATIRKGVDGAPLLEVSEPFDRAWRRVGLALDRVGFTVEDRDRQKGLYFVRYADPQTGTKKKDGLLGKLAFWRDDKPTIKPEQYRIAVTGADDASRVQVLGQSGGAEDTPTANRILGLLQEQLK